MENEIICKNARNLRKGVKGLGVVSRICRWLWAGCEIICKRYCKICERYCMTIEELGTVVFNDVKSIEISWLAFGSQNHTEYLRNIKGISMELI